MSAQNNTDEVKGPGCVMSLNLFSNPMTTPPVRKVSEAERKKITQFIVATMLCMKCPGATHAPHSNQSYTNIVHIAPPNWVHI